MRKKWLVSLLFLFCFSVQTLATTLLPYYTSMTYLDASKTKGTNMGIFGSTVLDWVHQIDGYFDTTDIDSAKQQNLGIVYTNLSIMNWAWKMGINSTLIDVANNNAYALILGANYYQVRRWNVGLDFYATTYQNPLNGTVMQVSPYVGNTITDFFDLGTLYVELQGNLERLPTDPGYGRNYLFSLQNTLNYSNDYFGVEVRGWLGERAFDIQKKGFVMVNSNDFYHGGYGGAISWFGFQPLIISVDYSDDIFTELNKTTDAHKRTMVVKASYSF